MYLLSLGTALNTKEGRKRIIKKINFSIDVSLVTNDRVSIWVKSSEGIPNNVIRSINDAFDISFKKFTQFELIDRQTAESILEKKGQNFLDVCDNSECRIILGKELGVDKFILVDVTYSIRSRNVSAVLRYADIARNISEEIRKYDAPVQNGDVEKTIFSNIDKWTKDFYGVLNPPVLNLYTNVNGVRVSFGGKFEFLPLIDYEIAPGNYEFVFEKDGGNVIHDVTSNLDKLRYKSAMGIKQGIYDKKLFKNKRHVRIPDDFKFFPKVPQLISQFRRLKDCENIVEEYLTSMAAFKEKLGMIFLQMPQNFAPKSFPDLENFIEQWPKEFPLTLELRHTNWYNQGDVAEQLYHLLESHGISHVITDTAGRRDLMHMRLTTPYAFIRYTGANHESDYSRMDDWLDRIAVWIDQGIQGIYFFVHQNLEKASPLLSAYFIEKLNTRFGYELQIPETQSQKSLF